jgi:transcriptional regulator with XRE-family HTH domain
MTEMTREQFTEEFRYLYSASGLTLDAVAGLLTTSRLTISRWFEGQSAPVPLGREPVLQALRRFGYRHEDEAGVSSSEPPTIAEVLAGHRPYGLDCKCGRPINSDDDWAQHLTEVILTTRNLTALFGEVRRVDVIGDKPGMVHEFWADGWMASPQDDGLTLKLFCYGDGDEFRAVRDRKLVADLKAAIAERAGGGER